ncbi:Uncharacterized [Moorella glycerini]|uniref:Carbohydrate diacid regulator n=1 Tax=Neomoorella stamsii TaxID=1266720 RepID=A0A9X7J2C0_9FIRM|nr:MULTISPECIES: helix-turn-helix domain-containing protein [Moorella]PRR72166.1 Carbohydrate diacid regulator [Moorella stamsii]CEP69467.1 Uncharacterized [Moorella glycerini]
MNLNMHILLDELRPFHPRAKLDETIDLHLKQARIMKGDLRLLSRDYVYITEAGKLQDGMSELPADANIVCVGHLDDKRFDELSCNLINIDAGLDLPEVFNILQEIFEKYAAWNRQMIDAIIQNEPLQKIFDIGAAVLENPIALFDASLALIMTAGELPENYQGTIWEEVIRYGYSPVEELPFQERKRISEMIRTIKEPFFYKSAPTDRYTRMIAGLNINGKHFGNFGLIDINRPFTMGQLSLVYHLKNVMELALSKNRELTDITEEPLYFIERLINGFGVEKKVVEYHLKKRKWGLEDGFYILNFSPHEESLDEKLFRTYIYRIKKLIGKSIIFTFENSIIAILRERDYSLDDPVLLRELDDLLSRIGIICGISLEFYNFMNLKYPYIQSKIALTEGAKREPRKWRYYFQDYYTDHIMNSLDNSTSLKSLYHPQVQKLKEYDEKNNTEYVRCLYTYLQNGLNVSQTARKLFIHRNTLTYRLNRIIEILGIDFRREEELFPLFFSCLIAEHLSQPQDSS